MPRVLLVSLLALLLLVPATAEGSSKARLRGTVAAKDPAAHLVSVKASRLAFSLRVPGSLTRIRAGQRVELRGSTLRAQSNGSRVLAQGVTIASSQPLSAKPSDDEADEDEIEITGKLKSLSPVTVESSRRTVSCSTPAGVSLTGFAVDDVVEMTCDLVGAAWVVRKLHLEDADDDDLNGHDDDEDEDDRSGHDDDDDEDDDDDSSGPGSGDDDDEDGD